MTEDAPPYDADRRIIIVDGEERTVTHAELQKMLGKSNVVHKAPDASKTRTRDDFLDLLERAYGFALEVPFRGLSGKRQFRWDACRDRVAVEYQGMADHSTWQGLNRDYEKANEGQLCGFVVIQCNVKSVRNGRCLAWVERALAQGCPQGAILGGQERR